MVATFYTTNARGLLAKFDARIRQKEAKGKIETWMISEDGAYYTHVAQQWSRKAWLHPHAYADALRFWIIKPKNAVVSVQAYGFYHGQIIETFLNHFDTLHTAARASPLPMGEDKVYS